MDMNNGGHVPHTGQNQSIDDQGPASIRQPLNMKVRYIRKSSLGRSRLICQSPLKCAGQIQNCGRFEFKKGKL